MHSQQDTSESEFSHLTQYIYNQTTTQEYLLTSTIKYTRICVKSPRIEVINAITRLDICTLAVHNFFVAFSPTYAK